MLIAYSLFMTLMFVVAAFQNLSYIKETNKLEAELKNALLNAPSTSVKELAADFRNFVEGIDGHISPEVEAAIKKLEEEQKPKALPQPQPKMLPPAKAEKGKSQKRVVMGAKMWNDIFLKEARAEIYADDKITVVKRWGKRPLFSLEDQVNILSWMIYSSDRDELRQYFDKYHNE